MRFRCQHKDKNDNGCNAYALPGREYCRWHLMPTRLGDVSGSWTYFYYIFFLSIGLALVLMFFGSLKEFITKGEYKLFISVLLYFTLSALYISWAVVLKNPVPTFWHKVLAITLGVTGAIFLFFSIIGAFSPAFAGYVLSLYAGENKVSYPSIYIIFVGAMGIYYILVFIQSVLMVDIPRNVSYSIVASFIGLFCLVTLYSEQPMCNTIILIIIAVYLLDLKFHWLNKIKEAMRF